jgi:hypothetical protein
VPPVGIWTKPFSGTNKAAYRSLAPGGTNLFLRVNDDGSNATDLGRAARVRGYEAMTGIDTGTGLFPTTTQVADPGPRWPKSETATSASRPWMLVANERLIYLWIAPSASTPNSHAFHVFGDLGRFKAADPYLCVHIGANASAGVYAPYNSHYGRAGQGSYGQVVVARNYLGTGGAIIPSALSIAPQYGGGSVGIGVLANPCVVDGKLWITPACPLTEYIGTVNNPRGRFPGLYEPLHVNPSPWLDFTLVEDFEGLPQWMIAGCGMKGLNGGVYHELVVDVSGDTW